MSCRICVWSHTMIGRRSDAMVAPVAVMRTPRSVRTSSRMALRSHGANGLAWRPEPGVFGEIVDQRAKAARGSLDTLEPVLRVGTGRWTVVEHTLQHCGEGFDLAQRFLQVMGRHVGKRFQFFVGLDQLRVLSCSRSRERRTMAGRPPCRAGSGRRRSPVAPRGAIDRGPFVSNSRRIGGGRGGRRWHWIGLV